MPDRDDEETWRNRGRPGHWDDEQRALESSKRRRTAVHGVPVLVAPAVDAPAAPGAVLAPEDLTPVFDLLDRDPDAEEQEVIRQSRRDSRDPAYVADIVKLGQQIHRYALEHRSSAESSARDLRDLLDRPPRDVADRLLARFAAVEEHVARHNRLIRWVGGLALASLVTVGTFLYARGVSEGGAAVKIEHLEKAVDELRSDIRALGRRSDATSFLPAPIASVISSTAPAPKDSP